MKYKITNNDTLFFQPSTKKEKFFAIDVTNITPGRLASFLVNLTKGKLDSTYSPNARAGYKIALYNCSKASLTGTKVKKKLYYFHSGFPGGLKTRTAKDIINGKNSHLIFQLAIKGMMSNTPMHRKIYQNDIKFFPNLMTSELLSHYNSFDFQFLNKKNSINNSN